MEFYLELEKIARDMFREMLLKLIEEGRGDAQDIILYFKKYGLEIPQSTVYSTLKELEKEGLIASKGTRNKKYELTEKGLEYIKSQKDKVEALERALNKLRTMNAMGVKDLLKALAELFEVIEELEPEEKARIAVALGAATTSIRESLAKRA